MNIKRKALGGFSQVTDEALIVRAMTILQAMTGNAFFEKPNPDLPTLQSHIDDFQDKLSIAKRKGSPMDTAVKNASRKTLSNTLQQLAFYVSNTADGDLQQLLSSGFDLSAYPRRGDVPDSILGIVLRDGRQSGQLRLDFQPQTKVLMYEYRFTNRESPHTDNDWSEVFTTTSSKNNIIAPLSPFERYYVQVRAVNGFGRSQWSEPVSHVIR
jgi:hypothetical protein